MTDSSGFEALSKREGTDVYYLHNFPVQDVDPAHSAQQDELLSILAEAAAKAGKVSAAIPDKLDDLHLAAAYDSEQNKLVALFVAEPTLYDRTFRITDSYTNSTYQNIGNALHELWLGEVVPDYIDEIGDSPVVQIDFGDSVDVPTEQMLFAAGIRDDGQWSIVLPNFVGVIEEDNLPGFEAALPDIVADDSGYSEDDNLLACVYKENGQWQQNYYRGDKLLARHTSIPESAEEKIADVEGKPVPFRIPNALSGVDMKWLISRVEVRRHLGFVTVQRAYNAGNLV